MDRRIHTPVLPICLVFLGILAGLMATPRPARAARNDSVKMDKRPVHQRRLTKIRPGSFIRREEPPVAKPDLRGAWERARDEQLALHTKRMAQLDVIAEVAAREDDGHLLQRVDVVRRRERERFRLAMEKIRDESRKQVWVQKQ